MYKIINSCCRCVSQVHVIRQKQFSVDFPICNTSLYSKKFFSDDKGKKDKSKSIQFEPIKNTSSNIIFDVDEEKQLARNNPDFLKLYQTPQEEVDEFEDLNLERGITGVYDIEDLVDVLKKQRSEDICVISISPEYNYVDFIVVVTGRSYKHMYSIASIVRRIFKKKYDQDRGDLLPKIEGENSKDWMALDLGNIALHIFSGQARLKYDLESLWCLGKELDMKYNDMIHDNSTNYQPNVFSLDDLKPIDDTKPEK